MRRPPWILLAVLVCVSGEYLMGGHLDNNAGTIKSRSGKHDERSASSSSTTGGGGDLDLDLVAEESTVGVTAMRTPNDGDNDNDDDDDDDDDDVSRYRVPYPFAFNGGEPFSLEKDPITGKIDLAKAPPVRALNAGSRYREPGNGGGDDGRTEDGKDNEDVGPNEINTYTPNFHDFLNLPVHYPSDKYSKDEFPLISSSYANTKVQSGANSYSTYNHKPYHSESDLYARPTKVSYASMMKTSSTHRTTDANNDLKIKWTNNATSTSTMTSSMIAANSSRIVLVTSTKAPVVTTWKPSNPPVSFHTIDSTIAQMENETNLLPIEKLHASGYAESHRNPNGGVPMRSPNNGVTTEKTQIVNRYKDQSNLNNFVLPHAIPETKPTAQNDGFKDIYDMFKLPDGEDEMEGDSDGDNDNVDDSDGETDNDEADYFMRFRELLKKDVTTTQPSTTASGATTSSTTSTTTTVATTVTASSTGTTITPSRSSAMPPVRQENAFASEISQHPAMPQHPFAPSTSSNGDRKPTSVTEHRDGIIAHGYRPGPLIKSEPDRTGIVIESTSNIVIPPDQDTVSFVLGNRQNVDGGYYSVGTAVGENIYDSAPDMDQPFWSLRDEPQQRPLKEIKHEHASVSVAETGPDRVNQKWWSPNSSTLKGSNELEPSRSQTPTIVVAGTVHDVNNQSNQRDPSYLTFPKDDTDERVVIANEADGGVRESSPIATNATKHNFPIGVGIGGGDLPQLAEDLMPPAESPRPPSYYYQYQFDPPIRPDHQRPQRLPLPPRVGKPPPYSGPSPDVGIRKRPPYVASDVAKLPNILPQFRPNAKTSHGHRGQDAIGTMPGSGQGLHTRIRPSLPSPSSSSSSRRPSPLPPPSYLQRLNPPPPPIHAVRLTLVPSSKADVVVLPHETESTIRRLRPSHVASSISRVNNLDNASTSNNRVLLASHGAATPVQDGGIESGDNRQEDNRIKSEINERENESSEMYAEEPPMMPPRPPMFPKRRMADPPRVSTLQMIQHHGEFGEGDNNDDDIGNEDNIGAESSQPARPLLVEAERRKSDDEHDETIADIQQQQQPVYVVYPVNTAVNIHPDDNDDGDKDGSVVVGTRGAQRPLPPDTLLQNEQHDETHTVYNGRPVALDFPYPLERPDPSSVFPAAGVKETPVLVPSEQRQQQQQQQASVAAPNERESEKIEQDAVNVIPYLQDFLPFRKKNDAAISVTLHRTGSIAGTTGSTSAAPTSTSTPIAYVYTPTHAAYPDRRFDDVDDIVDTKQTILLPSQQPSSSSSSAPEPQSFMAPFIASMNAETSNKDGWSVIVVDPPTVAERKSDVNVNETKTSDEIETQTERNDFDADHFKPQLFSGFQPIYEFPMEDAERRDETSTETNVAPRKSKQLAART